MTVEKLTMSDLFKAHRICTKGVFEILKFHLDLRELWTCEHPKKLWVVMTCFGKFDAYFFARIPMYQV
jgi:hypothetical protein